ncbi:MAG: peptide chain release factor N(5)-glutamine methyltransferase [Candidatus Omnitrophica bacterium]|jgi:release factor glutamine methyltransferase|nr:peptide chain release factor N(5)-glutamine methyltransferase [Candidatus Omnitrophota bacterium]
MKEAETALTYILNCRRADLYLDADLRLNKQQAEVFSQVLLRRIKHEPLQYILGRSEFMGLDFKVNKNVLIPRPETEILVETAIKYMKLKKFPRILDLGTGSGCIGVSLSKMVIGSLVSASDISALALEVAKENSRRHSAKIKFLQGDLFAPLEKQGLLFDLIVSNPPYIAKKDFAGLAEELSFEPLLALQAGVDGLDLYRKIAENAADYLLPKGLLILELGFGQRSAVENLLSENGKFEIIETINDYNDIARVLVARKEV